MLRTALTCTCAWSLVLQPDFWFPFACHLFAGSVELVEWQPMWKIWWTSFACQLNSCTVGRNTCNRHMCLCGGWNVSQFFDDNAAHRQVCVIQSQLWSMRVVFFTIRYCCILVWGNMFPQAIPNWLCKGGLAPCTLHGSPVHCAFVR